MKGFLDYVDKNSVLHRLNPLTKLGLSILICVGCFASGNLIVLASFLVFDLVLAAVGKIFTNVLKMLRVLLGVFALLFVLQVLFVQEGNVLVTLPLGVLITDHGFEVAASVVLKLLTATLPLAMLLMLTKLSDLSNTLVTKLHVPYKYAFAVTETIHFIPGFMNDMRDIMEAQKARGVDFDTKNFVKKIGFIAPLCVPLLVSSVKKTDSAAIAARLRGFNLRTRKSCSYVPKFGMGDGVMLVIGLAVAVVGIIF